MNALGLLAVLPMLLLAAMLGVTPAITRPTLQFGVRIPPERADAPVIGRERHAYQIRVALLILCLALAAVLVPRGSWWLFLFLDALGPVAVLACFWLARRGITAAKNAEGWYDGLTQGVTADTSWRTRPLRFPLAWLLPAVAVLVATAIVGAVRYPGLPGSLAVHFTSSGTPEGWVGKSLVSVFLPVAAQLAFTALVTVQYVILYRSRPDIDAGNAADSTRRYRDFLARTSRLALAFVALENLGLMLRAFQIWQVYRLRVLPGVTPSLPALLGGLLLVIIAMRMGQGGSRLLPGLAGGPGRAGVVNRDDDRFWKGGLFYVNHGDPAILVGKRFGVGWTLNFGNVRAWLLVAGMVLVAVVVTATTLGP